MLADEPTEADTLAKGGAGVARVAPNVPAKVGEQIRFAIDLDEIHFFDPATGAAIQGRPSTARSDRVGNVREET